MANVIKLRKGLDINLKGKAAETYATVKEPGFYALVPDDFPGVTPKVVVKEQEYVMAGLWCSSMANMALIFRCKAPITKGFVM